MVLQKDQEYNIIVHVALCTTFVLHAIYHICIRLFVRLAVGSRNASRVVGCHSRTRLTVNDVISVVLRHSVFSGVAMHSTRGMIPGTGTQHVVRKWSSRWCVCIVVVAIVSGLHRIAPGVPVC